MSKFADIYGHEQIKEHLQNAIRLNKVSHAYIFNGSMGSGKKMTAEPSSSAWSMGARGSEFSPRSSLFRQIGTMLRTLVENQARTLVARK